MGVPRPWPWRWTSVLISWAGDWPLLREACCAARALFSSPRIHVLLWTLDLSPLRRVATHHLLLVLPREGPHECVQGPLAFHNRLSRGRRPRAPLGRYPTPSCGACPAPAKVALRRAPPCCRPLQRAPHAPWARRGRRRRALGGTLPSWRRTRPC